MSEPLHQISGDWNVEIDWDKMDLLDACYDPMLQGMSLGGQDLTDTQPDVSSNGAADTAAALSPHILMTKHDQPLAASELILLFSPENGHVCLACKDVSNNECFLLWHAKEDGPPTYSCPTLGCKELFLSPGERNAHARTPHTSGHGRVVTETPYGCVECGLSKRNKASLLRHGKETQHQPYACECGTRFSRVDVLNRHLQSFNTAEPEFPCIYCKRHRGPEGFRRKDHLMQHIRNYHHHEIDPSGDTNASSRSSSRLKYEFPVCSHPECFHFRSGEFKLLPLIAQEKDKPFVSQAAYTKHMREEHNETSFPCDVEGCSRVGRRGYSREKDLIRHRRESHIDAPDYVVSQRPLRHQCTEQGCSALLDQSSLKLHYSDHKYGKRYEWQ